MKHSLILLSTVLFLTCDGSSSTGINKNLNVDDGEHRRSGIRSVNGSIEVGNRAVVDGNCSTVNGEIRIGESAKVAEVSTVNGGIHVDRETVTEDISCVNGSISLGNSTQVAGEVSTVNGSIDCDHGALISGNLETVNGRLALLETEVKGDIHTVNGNIDLKDHSIVRGDIIIKRKNPKMLKKLQPLTILVDENSKVKGSINVKGDDPNVTVVLSGGGEVLGDIINAEVVRK